MTSPGRPRRFGSPRANFSNSSLLSLPSRSASIWSNRWLIRSGTSERSRRPSLLVSNCSSSLAGSKRLAPPCGCRGVPSAAAVRATRANAPAPSAQPRMPLMTVSLPYGSGLLSGFRHADEATLVLARQCPQEGADVGALEEEADAVDLHRRLARLGPVPVLLELAADVPGQQRRP